jgi:hypothetical protein
MRSCNAVNDSCAHAYKTKAPAQTDNNLKPQQSIPWPPSVHALYLPIIDRWEDAGLQMHPQPVVMRPAQPLPSQSFLDVQPVDSRPLSQIQLDP